LHRRILGKGAVGLAGVGVAVALMAGPAFANDCFNASRNPNVTPNATQVAPGVYLQGHWVNFGDGWGFVAPGTNGFGGNFTDGKTDALLANAAANSDGRVCGSPNRDISNGFDTLSGVQSPDACWGP
jgi:hypothetical protein